MLGGVACVCMHLHLHASAGRIGDGGRFAVPCFFSFICLVLMCEISQLVLGF